MDSDSDLDIKNAQALTGLWQEEEQRLHKILSDPQTSPEIRQRVNARLEFVRNQIRDAAHEQGKLQRP